MNGFPCMIIDIGHIMHLGMTIMAWCDAVLSLGCKNLIGLGLAVSPPLLLETGLEKTASAATAKIIGFIRCHVNKIFFTNNCFNNISQVFCHRVAKCFSHQLTGILNRELDFPILVPVRRGFEFTFSDPLSIELNNTFYFKIIRDIEFFQSCQDCEEFVPSLGVEPDFTA